MQQDDFSDRHSERPETGTGTQTNYGSAGGQGGSSFRGGNEGPGGTIPEASLFRRGNHAGRGPKGYRRPDPSIREALAERLMWDDEIDASDVEIEVRDGVVLLTGTVQDRRDKWRIEDIAEEMAGVREVTNRIRLARRGGLFTG